MITNDNFVMNNKQLSFIKYEQQAAGELEYAIDFSDMDHAKFAEAAGGKGYVLKILTVSMK